MKNIDQRSAKMLKFKLFSKLVYKFDISTVCKWQKKFFLMLVQKMQLSNTQILANFWVIMDKLGKDENE